MTTSTTTKSIKYSTAAIRRGERALCCSPFQLGLLTAMARESISLGAITGSNGYEKGYTKIVVSLAKAESSLMWFIDVGLLRREVDGQGLTDSFRLTPLGRQLAAKWQERGGSLPQPSWCDRLQDTLTSWFKWLL